MNKAIVGYSSHEHINTTDNTLVLDTAGQVLETNLAVDIGPQREILRALMAAAVVAATGNERAQVVGPSTGGELPPGRGLYHLAYYSDQEAATREAATKVGRAVEMAWNDLNLGEVLGVTMLNKMIFTTNPDMLDS